MCLTSPLALVNLFIFVISTDIALVSSSVPKEGTGQKAHFSLKDTPGSFTVHANKLLAKVSSKADSIHVVVKPGMAEYPLPPASPTQKPLVHVVSPAIARPVGGWNFMSFGRKKRSAINKAYGKAISLKQMTKDLLYDKHVKEVLTNVFKTLKNDLMSRENIANNDQGNIQERNEKNSANVVSKKAKIRFRQGNLRPPGVENHVKKSKLRIMKRKRELVERKMSVHGGTGKFSVHVDSKQSNVSSSTGGVKIFIKNPSPAELSQLPRGMLQLPGAMVELPQGMSQSPGPLSQLTEGTQKPPFAVIPFPHDWTGASDWDDDDK